MKILHVIHDHPAHPTIGGGGGVRVREIAMRLAGYGHEVHVVSGWFDGCEAHTQYAPGCRVSFLGPHRRPACKAVEFAMAAWPRLPSLAKDVDLIIEDFSPYSLVGTYRFQNTNKPVVLQIQNYMAAKLFSRHGPAGLPIYLVEKWYPRLFRHHILVGDHLQQRFRPKRSSRVVPMGFTMESKGIAAPAHKDYIAYLGRFDFNQKGLDILLDALQGTALPVWFAGMGREGKRLREAVRSLPQCRVLDALQGAEKWDFLRAARFMALPSRFEGQPIVAIEAAAAGTPILASSIAELDFISAEKIGRQFAPFDAASLRKALLEMWNAPEDLADYAEAGKRFASARSWDQIAKEFEIAIQAIRDNP